MKPKTATQESYSKPRLASHADRDAAAQLVSDYLAYVHGRDDVGGDAGRQVDGDELAAYLSTFAAAGTFDTGAGVLQRNMRAARIKARHRIAKAKGVDMTQFIAEMAKHENVSEDTVAGDLYRPDQKPRL